jgi:hypothetical protein
LEQVVVIKGLDYFRNYFKDFQESYILIGGTACDVLMDEAGLKFRATKDLDIVLCAEALNAAFVVRFWEFVKEGGYKHKERSSGDKQFYRFNKPLNPEFPYMLELFSRKPDELVLDADTHLTPIPIEEDISSLSAILLDDDYYQCIENGRLIIDGASILGPEYIVPFKAKAWLDLSRRKADGEAIDSKQIKKHRNDVFRVFVLLSPEQPVMVAEGIKHDMKKFVEAMPNQQGLDMKSLGLKGMSLDDVLQNLTIIYMLES